MQVPPPPDFANLEDWHAAALESDRPFHRLILSEHVIPRTWSTCASNQTKQHYVISASHLLVTYEEDVLQGVGKSLDGLPWNPHIFKTSLLTSHMWSTCRYIQWCRRANYAAVPSHPIVFFRCIHTNNLEPENKAFHLWSLKEALPLFWSSVPLSFRQRDGTS